jgi:hypothetical protein
MAIGILALRSAQLLRRSIFRNALSHCYAILNILFLPLWNVLLAICVQSIAYLIQLDDDRTGERERGREMICVCYTDTHWEKNQNVAVCYRVPQRPITAFVALYVTGFRSCRSLHLWRCMLQGSTAAYHWICGDVWYMVPQLLITV